MDNDALTIESQLCFAVYSASHAFTRAYRSVLAATGLTYPQYLVMLVLWRATKTVGFGELCSALKLDSSTLTPLLQRLEARGLLTRSRSAEDGRAVQVTLTQTGKALREQVRPIPRMIGEATGMSEHEYQSLMQTLARLRDALDGSTLSQPTDS